MRRRPRVSAAGPGAGRVAPVVMAAVIGLAVLAPAWTQIDTFGSTNTGGSRPSTPADASGQAGTSTTSSATCAATAGAGSYAGMPSNWGSDFTVGAVPVFKYLESRDVDEVGYTLRTASLMTDPEYFFDEDGPGTTRSSAFTT